MEISIINEQRRIRLNKKRLESLTACILKILNVRCGSSLGITFVDRAKIRSLNRKYLKKNRLTDVIAFRYDEASCGNYLGDLVICPETALNNSILYKNTFSKELTLCIVHGVLHLLGYDDTRKTPRINMQKKEQGVMEELCHQKH